MNFKENLQTMKKIQKNLLDYLNDEKNSEENYRNIQQIFEGQKIKDDYYFLYSVLQLISKIADNHKRNSNFFDQIEKIIINIKDIINEKLNNYEIFTIFQNSKRLLLFLIEEKILLLNDFIISQIFSQKFIDMKYPDYLRPEINIYKGEETKINDFDDFNY